MTATQQLQAAGLLIKAAGIETIAAKGVSKVMPWLKNLLGGAKGMAGAAGTGALGGASMMAAQSLPGINMMPAVNPAWGSKLWGPLFAGRIGNTQQHFTDSMNRLTSGQ